MTIAIGVVLILIALASLALYPPPHIALPFFLIGAVLLLLRVTGAIAADLPVLGPQIIGRPVGTAAYSPATRRAIADLDRRRRMSQANFEKLLLRSSNAKDRLE